MIDVSAAPKSWPVATWHKLALERIEQRRAILERESALLERDHVAVNIAILKDLGLPEGSEIDQSADNLDVWVLRPPKKANPDATAP